jgi:hypothetical protein
MPTALSPEALAILRRIHIRENRVFLPTERLPPKLYHEVKEACTRLGGRWNTPSQSIIFTRDPTPLIAVLLESGLMPPRNPFAFFETPNWLVEEMLRYAFAFYGDGVPSSYRERVNCAEFIYVPKNLRILEPSAGTGRVAEGIRRFYHTLRRQDYVLHCCELNPINQALLRRNGFQIIAADFLCYILPSDEERYDVIIMNPPFDGHTYIEHIQHAWSLLKPGGRLVAITPRSFRDHSDARCRAFDEMVMRYREDLPIPLASDTFKASGTTTQTFLLSLVKQDMQWKHKPSGGFPNWYCYALAFQITNTQVLSDKRLAIWQQMESGKLPGAPTHAAWEKTQRVLRSLFTEAVQSARDEWVDIQVDETLLQNMEQHFLRYWQDNCQCPLHEQARKETHLTRQALRCSPHAQQSTTSNFKATEHFAPEALQPGVPQQSTSPEPPAPQHYVQQKLFSI